MAINKIGGITTAMGSHDDKTENDKWDALQQVRRLDDKLNARAGFRNAMGLSQEEYKKQANEAQKQGFEAILQQEMKKRS